MGKVKIELADLARTKKNANTLRKAATADGLNVLLGSAISFGPFPKFWEIRDGLSKAVFARARLYEDGNAAIGDRKNKSFRTEMVFEELNTVLEDSALKAITHLSEMDKGDIPVGHQWLAKLLHAGIVRRVFTTNWDRFLERALQALSSADGLTNEDNLIVKLHGTLPDLATIKATVSNTYKESETPEFNRFIAEFGARPALVIGYSGQDQDIREAIFKASSQRPIFWLCHNDVDALEVDKIRASLGKDRRIQTLRGDLNFLLQELATDSLDATASYDNGGYMKKTFGKHFVDWAESLSIAKSLILAGLLFQSYGHHKAARKALRMALNREPPGTKDSILAHAVLGRMLCAYTDQWQKALDLSLSGIPGAKESLDNIPPDYLADLYDNAATAEWYLGNLDEALQYSNQAVQHSAEGKYMLSKGVIFFEMMKYEDACANLEDALIKLRRGGYYLDFLSALNNYSLAITETIGDPSLSCEQTRDRIDHARRLRVELEKNAELYQAYFYLSCALVNTAEELHLCGLVGEAASKAMQCLELDFKDNPADPDIGVTVEILTWSLIDAAYLLEDEDKARKLLNSIKTILSFAIKLKTTGRSERACLNGLLAVVRAEAGETESARPAIRKLLVSARKKNVVESFTWVWLCVGKFSIALNDFEEAYDNFMQAARSSLDNLFYLSYSLQHAALAWLLNEGHTPLSDEFELLAKRVISRLPDEVPGNDLIQQCLDGSLVAQSNPLRALAGDRAIAGSAGLRIKRQETLSRFWKLNLKPDGVERIEVNNYVDRLKKLKKKAPATRG
jgi:tetratricopeptide (TPR) repeat protein